MYQKGDIIENVNGIPGIVSRTYYLKSPKGDELVICGFFDRSPHDEFRLPESHIRLVKSVPQMAFDF